VTFVAPPILVHRMENNRLEYTVWFQLSLAGNDLDMDVEMLSVLPDIDSETKKETWLHFCLWESGPASLLDLDRSYNRKIGDHYFSTTVAEWAIHNSIAPYQPFAARVGYDAKADYWGEWDAWNWAQIVAVTSLSSNKAARRIEQWRDRFERGVHQTLEYHQNLRKQKDAATNEKTA
jgi:hypothetical protein